MNVFLREGGDMIPTDVVVAWRNRSDLAPVPRTLEFTVKLIDGVEAKVKEGASVWGGRENLQYLIVKTDRSQPLGQVQGANQQQSMKVTALLHSCASIASARPMAVVQENTTFGAAYRACGAYAQIDNDFVVPRFSCFKGKIPSYPLVQVLQEEGAALVMRGGRIGAMRLADMAKQLPVDNIGQIDSSAMIASEYLQLQDVPMFYSTNAEASLVQGPSNQVRTVEFRPRTDVRRLRNASSVLVRSKTVDSTICQQILAGDVLQVAGENLIVITALHAFENLEGAQESRSRLWLGRLVNAV
ncbi:hypothetical protein [Pseudomonas sp. PNPG3]|uniref:hypothetical protein n=1 Tax=Pseudomonas sp. PNPG3 TaxID=2919497 RepID=UPI001FFC3F24|nr:hypothetical protein [Pseudomonas sp. PNPG3]MCK2122110.1 hypothetical protein [Pseudomonas sp. PNPG3]